MAGSGTFRESFTAYGARRGAGWSGAPTSTEWQGFADNSRRGFTGHEMLDNVNLIHMNGRVYDPVVGVFLSRDPLSGKFCDVRSWNAYAYVLGNPLNATDPSGLVGTQIFSNNGVASQTEVLEEIVVTATRIPVGRSAPSSPGASLGMASYGSAQGPASRGPRKDNNDSSSPKDSKKCVEECMSGKLPAIKAKAGALGGAVDGGVVGAIDGGIAAGPAGAAAGFGYGAVIGGGFGGAVGYVGAMNTGATSSLSDGALGGAGAIVQDALKDARSGRRISGQTAFNAGLSGAVGALVTSATGDASIGGAAAGATNAALQTPGQRFVTGLKTVFGGTLGGWAAQSLEDKLTADAMASCSKGCK
jgi:RHS repeat-associated protein